MKIKIISIGNNPPKWVQDILVKYTSRFDTHFKIEFIEIKSEKNFKSLGHKKLQEAEKILKFIGSCYLLYLAYRIYKSDLSDDKNISKPITFIESLLFQFVNPKGVMMAISIISIYSNYENFTFISSYIAGVILILLSCLITNLISVISWTLIGIFLENFIKSSAAIKKFNLFMSGLLVLTIGLIYLDIN